MIVEDTSIHNIDSAAWTAISFTLGATGFVERTSIAQNTGLDVSEKTASCARACSHSFPFNLNSLGLWRAKVEA